MKLQVVIPFEKNAIGQLVPPRGFYNERVVSVDHEAKNAIVEFGLEGPADTSSLVTRPQAVTEKNVDEIWNIIRIAPELSVNRTPSRYTMDLITHLLSAKGWANLYDLFDVLPNQKGFGFMGGTGCGRLVHDLVYDLATGVKPELAAIGKIGSEAHMKWQLATLMYSGMLGHVQQVRQDNKHLRDRLAEREVFVTLRARPTCQQSVAYVTAHGYPLPGGETRAVDLSCTKCAKHLKLPVNAVGRRRAGVR